MGQGRLWTDPSTVPAARSVKVLACPLLILHAEDDAVLPVHLGRKVGTGGLQVVQGLPGRERVWDPAGGHRPEEGPCTPLTLLPPSSSRPHAAPTRTRAR